MVRQRGKLNCDVVYNALANLTGFGVVTLFVARRPGLFMLALTNYWIRLPLGWGQGYLK